MKFLKRLFSLGQKPEDKVVPENEDLGFYEPLKKQSQGFGRPRARVQWRSQSWPMNIVGESNYQDALIAICGNYTRAGREVNARATITREPENPYDPYAVRVEINRKTVGYLPREQATRVSKQMLEDLIDHADCDAIIKGGWRTNQFDEGFYGVRLAIPTRDWIDFGLGKTPPGSDYPKTAESGPLSGQKLALIGASATSTLAHEFAGLGAHIMARPGKTSNFSIIVKGANIDDISTSAGSDFRRAKTMVQQGSKQKILTEDEFRELMLTEDIREHE